MSKSINLPNIEKRVLLRAQMSLLEHDFEILETLNSHAIEECFNFVCRDTKSNDVVFIGVAYCVNKKGYFQEKELNRTECEHDMAEWLMYNADKYGISKCPVRADTLSISVLSNETAFTKHHKNALLFGEGEESTNEQHSAELENAFLEIEKLKREIKQIKAEIRVMKIKR